jgi:hypothetical protein
MAPRNWRLIITFMASERSLETLTADDFREHKNTRFRLTSDSPEGGTPVSVEAELASVTEYADNALGTFRIPFSVVFHGPLEPVLPQGIHRLEHEGLGTLELFVVPIGPDEPDDPGEAATAMRYEVVFG